MEEEEKEMKIKYTKYGFAARVGDIIYLSKDLDKYPELKENLIKHEKAHTSNYAWKDIMIDWKGEHLHETKKQQYKFILTHPKSWTQVIPFWIYNKRLVVDPVLCVVWTLIIIMFLMAMMV